MKYILRKLLTLIITLFIVSLLAFLAFQVIPGSPATSMLGTNATPEKVAQLEDEMGLDDPVLVRYGRWVADFVQGDWGESYSYNLPVKDMVLEKLPATAALVLLAFAITVAASFPLGIATARREGSRLDRIITVVNQICMSIPPVFVGIAFDSGGVASGPMTSTCLLPLAMGACGAVGGNVVTDAFGIVALVALAPLIAIQIMGLLYARRTQAQTAPNILDDTVVELEEY